MGRFYGGLGIKDSTPSGQREGSVGMHGHLPESRKDGRGAGQGQRGSVDQGPEGQDERLRCVSLDTGLLH